MRFIRSFEDPDKASAKLRFRCKHEIWPQPQGCGRKRGLLQEFLGRFFAEPLHVHLGEFAVGAGLVNGRINGFHEFRLVFAHRKAKGFAVENLRKMVVGLGGFRTRRKEVGRHGAICDHGFAALVAELEIGVVDRVEAVSYTHLTLPTILRV